MVKQKMHVNSGEIAKAEGLSRSHISRVIHGKVKSRPQATLLWVKYGIRSKNQGLTYLSNPRMAVPKNFEEATAENLNGWNQLD